MRYKYYFILILISIINTCLMVYSLYLSTDQFGFWRYTNDIPWIICRQVKVEQIILKGSVNTVFGLSLCLGLWWFSPLSTIVQLYHGGQFYWSRKLEYPEKTTDLSQVTLSHHIVYLAWVGIKPTNWTLFDKITMRNVNNTKLQTFLYKSYILKVNFLNVHCFAAESSAFCLEDVVHLFLKLGVLEKKCH